MLIDEVTIEAIAGNGGDGTVAFNRNKMELGPTGASGGHGGSVFCTGIADIGALAHWRNTKVARAADGHAGGRQYRDGEDGPDYEFSVPVGTVIHTLETGTDVEITAVGQRVLLARGGRGGRGNYHFRSSLNTSPKQFEPGTPGQRFTLRLELKLIADVGLIGLPNAGKSSFLNEVTAAQQKVANYPFTTLEPGLGAYYDLIIADIPGLIEGAASGRGLGAKFLRHIERTRTLLHLVSCESDDAVRDWRTVREELAAHDPALLMKPEHVLLSKSDLVPHAVLAALVGRFMEAGVPAVPFSIHDPAAVEQAYRLLRSLTTATAAAAPARQ